MSEDKPIDASAARPIPGDRYDLRVLQSLRQIIRAIDLHSRRLLKDHRITSPQLVTLLTIKERQPVTARNVASEIHLSPSTMVGILDRLETRKLVHRERDTHDRRMIHLTLTSQGEALVEKAPSPLQDTLAEAMGNLDDEELATIAESLERVVSLMQVQHLDAAPILETGPINGTTNKEGGKNNV